MAIFISRIHYLEMIARYFLIFAGRNFQLIQFEKWMGWETASYQRLINTARGVAIANCDTKPFSACGVFCGWSFERLMCWRPRFSPRITVTWQSPDSCCWGKLARTTQRVIQVRERHLMFADSGHHCRLRPMYSLWNLNWSLPATIIQEWAGGFGTTSIYYSGFNWSILALSLWGTPSCSRTRSRPCWITCHILSYC